MSFGVKLQSECRRQCRRRANNHCSFRHDMCASAQHRLAAMSGRTCYAPMPGPRRTVDATPLRAGASQLVVIELAQPVDDAASPPLGGKRAPAPGERLDQAAPPRAPPIRCKEMYRCCNNEIGHKSSSTTRVSEPISTWLVEMPRGPLDANKAVSGSASTRLLSRRARKVMQTSWRQLGISLRVS